MHYHLFDTGHCLAWEHHLLHGAQRVRMECRALATLLQHPTYGWIAWDTGYAPRMLAATAHWPARLYRVATPLRLQASQALVEQLGQLQLQPADIRMVIVSHFHADHVAGLLDFPHAQLVATQSAWDDVVRRRGFAALRRGYLPTLIPADFAPRAQLITTFADAPLPILGPSHDLFGDGLLRLVPLPGHARGQMGLLAQTAPGPILFAADGCWHSRAYRECRPPHPITRFLVDDMTAVHATIKRLHEFSAACPAVTIVPSHCPEIFARLVGGIMIKA